MSQRDVYTAVADPTRREILDLLLSNDDMAAGHIALQFPSVSRPAISRHLRVLRECDVVKVQRRGKQQHYSVHPKPLHDLREGWLTEFSKAHIQSLKALRRIAEQPAAGTPVSRDAAPAPSGD